MSVRARRCSRGLVVNVYRSTGPGPKQWDVPVNIHVHETGEVKVVVDDVLGERIVYDQTQQPGDTLHKDFELYGSGVLKDIFSREPGGITSSWLNDGFEASRLKAEC